MLTNSLLEKPNPAKTRITKGWISGFFEIFATMSIKKVVAYNSFLLIGSKHFPLLYKVWLTTPGVLATCQAKEITGKSQVAQLHSLSRCLQQKATRRETDFPKRDTSLLQISLPHPSLCRYPFIFLCEKRHGKSQESCHRTQHHNPTRD